MTSGINLRIGLGFNDHAPNKPAVAFVFQRHATGEVGGDLIGRAGEQALGERWEGVHGYGSGLRVLVS